MTEIKLSKHFAFISDLGFNYHLFLIAARSISGSNYFHDSKLLYFDPPKDYSVNGGIGIKINWNKFSISVKPNCNYFLHPNIVYLNNDNKNYKINFYSVGVELGLQFKLYK
jgi:hypothetical protein